MIRMKLIYDAYNRTFKLIDREFGVMLEDGAVYELKLPLMVESADGQEDLIPIDIGRSLMRDPPLRKRLVKSVQKLRVENFRAAKDKRYERK